MKGTPIPPSDKKTTRINEQIRTTPIRVIDQDGNQLGVIPTQEALDKAKEAGLDLVEVAGDAKPPVCRIMDFSKYKYDQEKKERRVKKAQKIIERDLVLTLDENSDVAVLTAYFEHNGLFNFGSSGLVNLDIRMPSTMHLDLEDGSGSIKIDDVHGDISVDDGSGSLALANVGGEVIIDDGSGSISARGIGGDLSINDGSGSIKIHDVAGSVTVDDGSGSINVQDVENDLIIVDDGSGSLDYAGINGDVVTDS